MLYSNNGRFKSLSVYQYSAREIALEHTFSCGYGGVGGGGRNLIRNLKLTKTFDILFEAGVIKHHNIILLCMKILPYS